MPNPSPTFYLLHGEDSLSRDEAVSKLRAKLAANVDPSIADMNTSIFDGRSATLADIRSACDAFPFLAERRLVIVDGMVSAVKGKELKALAAYLPTLPDWTRLLLIEDKTLSARNAIVKLARTHARGYEKTFNPPRNATQWIRKRAARHGCEIEPAAAAALSEVVGSDLRAADNELVKLAAYVDGARAVTVADVTALTVYVAEANIFEMVDMLVQGDAHGAATRLHRLLEKQEPLSLFGMIVRQFRLLLLTKTYLESGGVAGGVADAIDVHPYAARKLPGQARKFSLPQLEGIYHRLLEYDVQMKTGQIAPDLALDLLVTALAR